MAPLMSEIAIGGMRLDGQGGNAFAQAFGLCTCAFSVGCVVGPIWAGLVLAKEGWGIMTWTLALLPVTAVVTSVVFVSSEIMSEEA
jgi:predicted MFS family arabinose efflux permease